MSKSNAARFLTRFIILGAAAGTLGGYSSYAMRQSSAQPASPPSVAEATAPQISNRISKADRLAAVVPASLTGEQRATFTLASLGTTFEFDRIHTVPAQPEAETVGALPELRTEPKPEAKPAEPKVEPQVPSKLARTSATPLPPERPKRPLPPPPAQSALLDDSQIAGLKARLRLTPEQAAYWPAVEDALREVARTQMTAKHPHGNKVSIDVNSPEVQKLIWAAMPLLMRLREDQKHEVRKLAHVIGLDQVASQI